jgi:hypothetical protein
MSWHLIDQIKSAKQQTQHIKDEYDEVLELLIDIVNHDDYSEQLLCIDHAKQYLEQLKKKR